MEWDDDVSEQPLGTGAASALCLPVRVAIDLSGTPWEFRARIVELASDHCVLVLVSACAPAMRRGAMASLHVPALGTGELILETTITDVVPRASGLTFQCAIAARSIRPSASEPEGLPGRLRCG